MSLQEDQAKARTLVEALPYIKRFAGKTIVIKYGGSLIATPKLIKSLANDIALLRYVGIRPVIVHGGGQEIQKWLKKLGKEPKVVDGQIFTDAETLQVTDMVISGSVSNAIVTSLSQYGVKAIGLSGRDANLFTTCRIKNEKQKDLGYVGEIESIDVSILNKLAEANCLPVISSVGLSRDGSVLNVESDLVASKIAAALKASKLLYLASFDGLSKNGKLIELLDLAEAQALAASDDLNPRTKFKLKATISALKSGVTDVHIINGHVEHSVLLEVLTDRGIGSMITNQRTKV